MCEDEMTEFGNTSIKKYGTKEEQP